MSRAEVLCGATKDFQFSFQFIREEPLAVWLHSRHGLATWRSRSSRFATESCVRCGEFPRQEGVAAFCESTLAQHPLSDGAPLSTLSASAAASTAVECQKALT